MAKKLKLLERAQMALKIKKGFGSGEYRTKSVAKSNYKGEYWKKGLVLIFEQDDVNKTEKKVDDYVYCTICDEVFYGNPSQGSAPFNRHMLSRQHVSAAAETTTTAPESSSTIITTTTATTTTSTSIATVTVPKMELARALNNVMEISVRYSVVVDVSTMAAFIPSQWSADFVKLVEKEAEKLATLSELEETVHPTITGSISTQESPQSPGTPTTSLTSNLSPPSTSNMSVEQSDMLNQTVHENISSQKSPKSGLKPSNQYLRPKVVLNRVVTRSLRPRK